MVQVTIKNIESEILILDNSLDVKFKSPSTTSQCTSSSAISNSDALDSWEIIKVQKEQALEEAKRIHEAYLLYLFN